MHEGWKSVMITVNLSVLCVVVCAINFVECASIIKREAICIENQTQNEEAYGIRLNGDTQRAPPWPSPRYNNEKMFLLPRKLEYGDKIHISGKTNSTRQILTVNLLTDINGTPDYQNVACQLEVRFAEDSFLLQTISNGAAEPSSSDLDPPSDLIGDETFSFSFTLSYTGYGSSIEVEVGPSFLGKVDLKHNINYIRFLTVHGDVEKIDKLEFDFA